MTSTSPAPVVHPYNRGLRAWIDAGAELADCTTPDTADIGAYAHGLVIPGGSHPVHGERRFAFNAGWTWDSDRRGWQRTA
jgi:hypothetical protein